MKSKRIGTRTQDKGGERHNLTEKFEICVEEFLLPGASFGRAARKLRRLLGAGMSRSPFMQLESLSMITGLTLEGLRHMGDTRIVGMLTLNGRVLLEMRDVLDVVRIMAKLERRVK